MSKEVSASGSIWDTVHDVVRAFTHGRNVIAALLVVAIAYIYILYRKGKFHKLKKSIPPVLGMFCVQYGIRLKRFDIYERYNMILKKECPFCNIVRNLDKPDSCVLYESEEHIAFPDINPSAERHILVIPKRHLGNISSVSANELLYQTEKMAGIGRKILAGIDCTDESRIKMGYHIPPYTSCAHLHLHVLYLPYVSFLRSLKYPKNWLWASWWITAPKLISRLNASINEGLGEATWKPRDDCPH